MSVKGGIEKRWSRQTGPVAIDESLFELHSSDMACIKDLTSEPQLLCQSETIAPDLSVSTFPHRRVNI
jgi:hypothetical protein